MLILDGFGFQRAQTLALEHLVALHCSSGDLRCAVAALAAQSFTAIGAFVQASFAAWLRNAAHRIEQRAALLAYFTPADTMVAAGGR
jgi:hypothetical protein